MWHEVIHQGTDADRRHDLHDGEWREREDGRLARHATSGQQIEVIQQQASSERVG